MKLPQHIAKMNKIEIAKEYMDGIAALILEEQEALNKENNAKANED
jgi:hypothetical protein